MLDSVTETRSVRSRPEGLRTASTGARCDAFFVDSEVFAKEAFGNHHPLSIPRHAGVLKMCGILGWLNASNSRTCPAASEEQLGRFHDSNYIQALKNADMKGVVDLDVRERYGIGTMENPLFPGVYRRAATTVGGSILAAQLALEGYTVFHPAGGTHHGRPDRAAGFCYFNDPVFAILTLLDAGLERVLYVDLDAHHPDGVQDAFDRDERVFTISIHEQERWPYSGPVSDRGGTQARNLPVPVGFNDSELAYLVNEAVLPLSHRFEPQALVVTCGADGLKGDPLSKMEMSNSGLWRAVESLVSNCMRSVVLGGGGYNPWTVVRCWSGLWGRLSGRCIPETLPPEAQRLLRSFECDLLDEDEVGDEWIKTLADLPNAGRVRAEVKRVAEQVLSEPVNITLRER